MEMTPWDELTDEQRHYFTLGWQASVEGFNYEMEIPASEAYEIARRIERRLAKSGHAGR